MGRYNLIQIGSVYITDTGLVGGEPCRTSVSGLGGLRLTKTGIVKIGLTRVPRIQLKPNGKKARVITILLETVEQTVLDNIVAALEAMFSAPGPITLNITGGPSGDHNLSVYPLFPDPIEEPDDFIDTRTKKVKISVITT